MIFFVEKILATKQKTERFIFIVDKRMPNVYNCNTGLDGELAVPCNLQPA